MKTSSRYALQDDSSDWVKESANMAAIYANGSLTISATSAADEEARIFRERPNPFILRGQDDSGLPYRFHVRKTYRILDFAASSITLRAHLEIS